MTIRIEFIESYICSGLLERYSGYLGCFLYDMPSKRNKEVVLGIYRTQIRPSEHDFVATSG